MTLSELLKQNPDAKQYFDSLPLDVQESMMQAGRDFESVEDLRLRDDWINHYKGLLLS